MPQQVGQGAYGVAHEMLVVGGQHCREMDDQWFDVLLEPTYKVELLFVVVADVADRIHDVLQDLLEVAALAIDGRSDSSDNPVLDEVLEEVSVVLGEVTHQV